MPNIKPISDLRNYKEVLKEVDSGSPVYLTKNGRGEYAIVKIEELDELQAIKGLYSELEKGEVSARKNGWLSADEIEASLGL